jgi:tetratricopeptide (TPR) repeat protein
MIRPDESPFDVGLRINSTRKSGDLREAVALAQEAMRIWPEDVHVLRAFAWCRYEGEIKPALSGSDQQGSAAAEVAARWVAQQKLGPPDRQYEEFDPTPTVVLQAIRALIAAANYEAAASLLQLLDPKRLSEYPRNGKFDPPLTDWFRYKTKALAEQQRWDELVELSKSPLRSLLNGQNVRWIEYRFATALRKVGRPQEALAGIERALAGKQDAWVKVLRAEILAELGRTEEAIGLFRIALASTRDEADLGFQVGGLVHLAQLLLCNEPDLAGLHVRVLVRVREANGWPIKQADRDLAAEVGTDLVRATDDDVQTARRWWKAAVEAQRRTGRVKRVFEHGGAGFLTADSGEDYYFTMPRKGNTRAPSEGTRVSFILIDGFDNKQNRATKQASQIRPETDL